MCDDEEMRGEKKERRREIERERWRECEKRRKSARAPGLLDVIQDGVSCAESKEDSP